MSAKDKPFIQFYVGDYIKNTRRLTLEEKGAWTEILWYMWTHGQNGVFEGTWGDLFLVIGAQSVEECSNIFTKIAQKKVCDFQIVQNNTKLCDTVVQIVNRRMHNEFKVSKSRSESSLSKKDIVAQSENKQQTYGYGYDNGFDIGSKFGTELLYNEVIKFLEFRKKIRKPILIDEETLERFWSKLKKYSAGNEQTAMEILDNSITNGWQGIFPPKDYDRNKKPDTASASRTGLGKM